MKGENASSELALISVAGPDRVGLTAALTNIMARYQVEVLDVGQAVIHDNLAWGMLVEIPHTPLSSKLYRDLVFEAHELGVNIRFSPITEGDYDRWVAGKGQARSVITLLGRSITADHIARVSKVVTNQGLNIERVERLSGRVDRSMEASVRRAAIEFLVRGSVPDLAALHESFLRIAQETDLDVAIQEDDAFRRNRRLVCFDMDSTLIAGELMDELAQLAGVGEEVAALTDRTMNGEVDFETSFRARLALLAGLEEERLAEVAERIQLNEGAERLIANLKRLGYKVAILSGGFTYFADRLKSRLKLDYVYAHELVIRGGKLTGEIVGEVITGDSKAKRLQEIATAEGLVLEQVIAVGDGANDLSMLRIAGLGIAFHAKPVVISQARHAIATLGLDGILYLLGMRERDIEDK